MIPDSCLEIYTSPVDRPSVPPWFAEVVIVAGYLAKKELLDALMLLFGCAGQQGRR